MVEHDVANVGAVGSNPITRSNQQAISGLKSTTRGLVMKHLSFLVLLFLCSCAPQASSLRGALTLEELLEFEITVEHLRPKPVPKQQHIKQDRGLKTEKRKPRKKDSWEKD